MRTDTNTDTKQALRDYIASLGLTYIPTFRPTPQPADKVKSPRLHWLITLERGKERMTFDYHEGLGFLPCGEQPAPKLIDILYCLVSDASVRHSAFYEEWAAEHGCDEDSRKGEEIYRACQKQTTDLLKILADGKVGRNALDILEKLEELYQDY